MQGNLDNANLADLLLKLHLARRSGIFRVSQSDVKKSIYFLDGSIVFAHSNQKYDRLGETLLRLGKITLEEFEIASREVIEKGKRLGQALSDLGFISSPEVSASVHYQLQQITYSLFDWSSGEFEFVERDRPVFEDIMIDISTPNLIIEGIRNMTNPDLLARSYKKNEQQVLYLNHGIPRLTRSDLDFSEETILACVDDAKTIEAVRQLAHLSRIEFDRGLSLLLLCGMLQLHQHVESLDVSGKPLLHTVEMPSPEQQSFTTQSMEETGMEGDSSRRMKTFSEADLRKLITDTAEAFHQATDEEVLQVLPDCTPREINEAYEKLTAQFHPPYYSQNRFLDVKDPLKFILDRLTSAHDNLMEKFRAQMPLNETPLPPLEQPAVKLSSQTTQGQGKTIQPQAVTSYSIPVKEPISELQERIRKDPGNAALLRRLGKRFHESGKPHEGEKQFLKALELEPQNIENHFALAEFYNSMGLKIKAFKHLNIVLQLQPNNAQAMELLNLKKSRKALYEIEH
jgi:hypothetical protein